MLRFSLFLVLLTALIAFARCSITSFADDVRRSEPANKELTSNSTGLKLMWLPASAFSMGSTVTEDGHVRSEEQHTVRITRPFYIGIYEVTQGEYLSVMGSNPSSFSRLGANSSEITGRDSSRLPVENVSWYDAVEFCNKLSTRDGLPPYYTITGIERQGFSIKAAVVTAATEGTGYRLPTEAEWEYACRGGSSTVYALGNAVSALDKMGWYGTNETSGGSSDQRTHRVGQKKPNAFGLYDLHGNVCEWCQDWSATDYYDQSPNEDPPGPTTGVARIVRGGGWNDDALKCRAAFRRAESPGSRSQSMGFRLVRSVQVSRPQTRKGGPPYRIVADLKDGREIDVYRQQYYDSLEEARQKIRNSRFFDAVGTIRIIDRDGTQVE